MKKAWKIFDKNGDGKLTPQEFRYKMNAASKIDFNDYDDNDDNLQVDDPPKYAF